jgi:hypothetical protein
LRTLSYQGIVVTGDTCVLPGDKEIALDIGEGIRICPMFDKQHHEGVPPNNVSDRMMAPSSQSGRY